MTIRGACTHTFCDVAPSAYFRPDDFFQLPVICVREEEGGCLAEHRPIFWFPLACACDPTSIEKIEKKIGHFKYLKSKKTYSVDLKKFFG